MTNTKNKFEDRVFTTLDKVKENVGKVHENLLKVSVEAVEGTLKAGADWQKVMVNSIKKGEKLMVAQQDLAFEALEGVKAIHLENVKRFRELVKEEKVEKLAKKKVKAVEKKAKAIEKPAKKVVKAAEKKAKTIEKKIETASEKIIDLKTINGIGPKLEEILKQAGITSVNDLLTTSVKKVEAILEAAGPRYKSFSPKEWKIQAEKLIKA